MLLIPIDLKACLRWHDGSPERLPGVWRKHGNRPLPYLLLNWLREPEPISVIVEELGRKPERAGLPAAMLAASTRWKRRSSGFSPENAIWCGLASAKTRAKRQGSCSGRMRLKRAPPGVFTRCLICGRAEANGVAGSRCGRPRCAGTVVDYEGPIFEGNLYAQLTASDYTPPLNPAEHSAAVREDDRLAA